MLCSLQVACGGNHTLAVCAHDTVQQEREEKKKGYTQRVMSMFSSKPVTVEVPDSRTHSSGPTTAGSGGITPLDRISDGSMSLMHHGSNGAVPMPCCIVHTHICIQHTFEACVCVNLALIRVHAL